MRYTANRKYPITHIKKNAETTERYLDMSVPTAAGLLAAVFAGGFLGGYLVKKWTN